MPPNEQPLLLGKAWTLEKPTSCREPGVLAVTRGRLAPPAPLFAAAILPGAAAAVLIACPSSSSRGPGLSTGRRGPSASVCLYASTVPALVAHASSSISKQQGEITNRDLAPKNRKALRKGGWTRGVGGRGLSRGGVLRLCVHLPPPALEQGAGT